ncbi:undecaprenyl-diphosphatase [Paenibacillus sp. 481]|uniref:undecaprenyl-diphosphatase n=1 Tax=Paenibacillus sp. 481 TaxID=2835869 RepID=UPI001E3283F0|nr:undecaprenyl-diphosphatase [Paenibacillus sp. 481]UHA71767.1 undecaprenyl-diphosphatase [Paenibacillus sp. 481]
MSFSEWNIEIFRVINDLGKQYPDLNPIAIFVAEPLLYMLALSMLVYWFTRTYENRLMVIQGGLAFILAEILAIIVGQFHFNYQPFAVLTDVNKLIERSVDNSFPSDHTIVFFAVCVTYWLVRKKEAWLWLIVACCVGVSRIWVGVHYPADVVMGASLAIAAALIVHWSIPKLAVTRRLLDGITKAEQRIFSVKNKSKDV